MDLPESIPTTSSPIIPQLDSLRFTDHVQEDILALVMNSSPDLSKTTTQEELIAQRISKRAAKRAEIRAKADNYKSAVTIQFRSLSVITLITIANDFRGTCFMSQSTTKQHILSIWKLLSSWATFQSTILV